MGDKPNMNFTEPDTNPGETTEERIRRIQAEQATARGQVPPVTGGTGSGVANIPGSTAGAGVGTNHPPTRDNSATGQSGTVVPGSATAPPQANPSGDKNMSGTGSGPNPGDNTGNKVDYTGEDASKESKVAGPGATKDDVNIEPAAGKTERQAALEEAQKILKEHGGLEGNIPLTSPYWALMNTYRTQ